MNERLPYARSFRDLRVYQKSRQVVRRVYEVSKTFPREEMYSLTDQVRRSSRSIGAQIAEAWAKRRYERHFVSKLTDADGEQLETQHWIDAARDCGYMVDAERDELVGDLEEVGAMLNSMIAKAHTFCGETGAELHDAAAHYFIEPADD
jgi:four helix bundle protein